jgi:hypothetical protein
MKKAFLAIIILLQIATICQAQKKEINEVKTSFDSYKSAILNDQGEGAVNYVDSRTIKYYGDILKKVKEADSSSTASLPLIDKIMVFSIRNRATKEEILILDGKGLLVFAIQKGMVAKNSVVNNTIGNVMIDGTFAKGQLVTNGQNAPVYFHFYKEGGGWKIDLTSIFEISNMALKKMVDDSGQTENEFLLMLLEMVSGKKPGSEIWRPTNKT